MVTAYAAQPTQADRAHKILSGVKWRFLSEAVTDQSPTSVQPPWTNEARRRIVYLERALASTHELELQYQSFVQEASKSGDGMDGISLDWESTSALLAPGAVHSAVTAEFANDQILSDQIPSDPVIPAEMPKSSGRGAGRRTPANAAGHVESSLDVGAGGHAEEDAEVSRVQQTAVDGDSVTAEEPRSAPSPVIIWRHAAPVKIASNLPPDLLPTTATLSRTSLARRQKDPEGSVKAYQLGSASARSAAAAGELNEKQVACAKRMQYGAWYLPTGKWASRAEVRPRLCSSPILFPGVHCIGCHPSSAQVSAL